MPYFDGMVDQAPTTPLPPHAASPSLPATPWPLDAKQQAFLLHLLQDPTQSMEAIADSMEWSLRVLNLYLSTEEGLLLVAQCELATAVRTRIAAAAQLHNAIDALGMMLQEYAHSTRGTLMDERKHTTHVLREEQRANARRAAHLLFRLAHFTPRPIKSYDPAPRGTGLPPGDSAQDALDNRSPTPALATPTPQPLALHAEGVEVNSRGSPRSGTPGESAQFVAHREAVQVPAPRHELEPAPNAPAPSPAHLSTSSPAHSSPSHSSPSHPSRRSRDRVGAAAAGAPP